MSKGTIIFIIIMSWTLIIYGGMTYLIVKKKEYSLISGFNNRPEEEKEYLIQQGYIEKLSKLLTYTFYFLIAAFLLTLFNVPFGAEIGFGLFTIALLFGTVYIQKFEVPNKRKKYLWISGSITAAVILFVGIIFGLGYMKTEITISNSTLEISGMYGMEWKLEDIEEVKLLDELPEVLMRTNGMSTTNVQKGNFRLEDPYGKGKLFVQKGSTPYLYIKKREDFIILNRENAQETMELYKKLEKIISK